MSTTLSSFVGREPELRVLAESLAAAQGGNGSVAMVVGEPGIGKTRTAREFAGVASSNGAGVVWGTCHEADWSPPFAPWIEAAGRLVESLAPIELERRLGSAAPALAEILPALRDALPDLPHPATLAAEEARYRSYEAFTRLLVRSEKPLVVVLDDLQWADSASIELLRYVGRSVATSTLLLVGTYRDAEVDLAHPLSSCLADLNRQHEVVRVRLSNLGTGETTALIEILHGGPLPPPLVGKVWRETAGNPFFVAEVIRNFDEGGDRARVPDSVREAVSSRLKRLSSPTVKLLSVAAAFAGPFEFAVLHALSDGTEDELLDSLDEALRASMLQALGDETYDFAHALVREALSFELSPSRKARLHRRIANALEEAYAGREDTVAAELAGQYSGSRSLPGAEHGVRYAITAAGEATRAHGHERAASFLRVARDLAAPDDHELRAQVLTGLAIAEAQALLLGEAEQSVEEALKALVLAGAVAGATVDFIVEAAWAMEDAGASQTIVQPLAARGLALLGDRRDLQWALLKLVQHPIEELRAGEFVYARWLGYDREAIEIARMSGDQQAYARTLETMEFRSPEGARDALAPVRGWTEPQALIHGLSVEMRSLYLQQGSFRECAAVSNELLDVSERYGSLLGQAYALTWQWSVGNVLGDFELAQASVQRAGEIVSRLGRWHRLRFVVSFAEALRPESDGEVAWHNVAHAAIANATDVAMPSWMTLNYVAAAAEAYASAGETEEASRLIDLVTTAAQSLGPTSLHQAGYVARVASATWELADAERAGPLRLLALELLAAGVPDYGGTSNELTVARMAALLGDAAEAAEYFARARRTLAQSGQRPLRAIVDLDEALALHRLGKAGALLALERARVQFDALKMAFWLRRADQLAAALVGPASAPADLTPRELEILRLVAGGRSSREIAESLVLSVHTVTRHIANAYRKIGAHNRAEATAFVLGHGLAENARDT